MLLIPIICIIISHHEIMNGLPSSGFQSSHVKIQPLNQKT